MQSVIRHVVPMVLLFAAGAAPAQEPAPDRTCFQTSSGYSPELDIGSDMAIVYGTGDTFLERVESWRQQGYAIGMMTGISWGGYEDYFGTGESFKKDEVQTRKDGSLRLHNPDIGYNVPTPGYMEYMKKRIEPAVAAGALAIFLEEPEFWADTGWSKAFKDAWQERFNEPWQAPDSSPDAQYRASKLKYELYFDALKGVFSHADALAKEQGRGIDCIVPTHSLINYAQWGIVSPESHLMDLKECDGYVAQVWTGTARTPNVYAGVKKERTFETAFLEYGQMLNMVRPTGRKVWFLHDPIEDNPNYSWNNYKKNYECTVVASLMWPDVHHFEVMPWPDRIFNGKYPKADMDAKSGNEGIPPDYATQVLTVINALNEMDQSEVSYDVGTQGIGVFVSDTLMFQRSAPESSDRALSFIYGLTLPFLKVGIPVEPVQLENVLEADTLKPYSVLLLTYEGQKPLKSAYHDALAQWVKQGGGLIVIDDGKDPYHHAREWWNENGATKGTALQHLYATLGVTDAARQEPQAVEKGFVRVVEESPSALTASPETAERVRTLVRDMLAVQGKSFDTQNYLKIQRGPFIVASVLDESISEEPLKLEGSFVDLFDPRLPVLHTAELKPDSRALLYDIDWAVKRDLAPKVLAAGTRIRNERFEEGTFAFTARGPKNTVANARVLLSREPKGVTTTPAIDVQKDWDASTSTLHLTFPNTAAEVAFTIGQ